MSPSIAPGVVEPEVRKTRQFAHQRFKAFDAAFKMVDAFALAEPTSEPSTDPATGGPKPLALE